MKLLKRITIFLTVTLLLTVFSFAADDLPGLYEELYQNLKEQNTTFTLSYTGDLSDLRDGNGKLLHGAELVRGMATTLPCEDEYGPDVLMMNLLSAVYTLKNGNELHFSAEYLLDKHKLDWVDMIVTQRVRELDLRDEPDLMKIKKIYEYVSSNFSYDQSLTKFTDYDGLATGSMVCQGYALLTYRMMWKAGIPCRIVVGTSRDEAHGWNIVRLDGLWYNLDTTWDSASAQLPVMTWDYFMKSQKDFTTHQRNHHFLEQDYLRRHPMAKESLHLNTLQILVNGVSYANLIIRNGKDLQLAPDIMTNTKIRWSSTNPEVASVDENGLLTSLTPGDAIVTATAEFESWLPGRLNVTAIDMRTCSAWAEPELTSYYLRKLYPAALCSDYQKPITREELAYLSYQMLANYANNPGRYVAPDFSDIEASPYWLHIIYVTGRGIFRGTQRGVFSPTATVTREMAAKVFCSLLKFMDCLPETEGTPASFTDFDTVSPWAVEDMEIITELGILQGDGSGALNPQGTLSREETAAAMERLFLRCVEPTLAESAE